MNSRVWFLKECSKHNIIPKTLQLRTPNTEPNKYEDSKTKNRYSNNLKSASIKNLQIAKQDAISGLNTFEKEFQEFVDHFNDEFTPYQKEKMENHIKKQTCKMKQRSTSQYKKKFGHL